MDDPVAGLLAALDLTPVQAEGRSEDLFEGPSQWMPHGRVYGGQVLAQSLVAASRTVADDRAVHSLHGYFLRPGDVDQPIRFAVDRIHDGRSFSTRRTQAFQSDGLPILSMIASFQDEDPGLDHQLLAPTGIPDPESVRSDEQVLTGIEHPMARYWADGRAFDIRHIDEPVFLRRGSERIASQAVWVRCLATLPDDPLLHRAALVYVSDYTLLEPVLRRHGLSWTQPGLKVASLDHAMWWHRPARADEWLLYTQASPNAIGGRGLSTGYMFRRDGTLVATVAQEGMVRVPQAVLDEVDAAEQEAR